MSVRDLRLRELWQTVRQPVSWGFAAAAVGVVVSFVIPSTYVVRTELSLNSAAQSTIGASLLGLAQQFGLGDNGGAGTPDFLVALFTSEDVLESAVQIKVPRAVYADLWFTDCSTTAETCDPIRIWKIDGKNARDTLERAAKKLTRAISVDLPNAVELKVVKCDPGVRGDTVSGAMKPATLETGYTLQVPLFINEGDILKIDTRTGEYLTRVG